LSDARAWGTSGPSFSGDSSLFAAAWPDDGAVKIVDLPTGRTVQDVRSIAWPADTAFDPAGEHLAIASSRVPTAVVVEVASGDDVFALEGHRGPVSAIAWSPDGKSIATAGFDGSARIFDARTGDQRFAMLGGDVVHSLDWSPDSALLVAA
jgi:WD40 repeat protein